jgi:hypothetical protein
VWTAACSPEVDLGATGDTVAQTQTHAGHDRDSGGVGSDAAQPDASGAPASGTVTFTTDSLSSPTSGVGAYFALTSHPDACTHRVVGACSIVTCASTSSDGPLTYLGAGAMTFTGFGTALHPAPIDGDPVSYAATKDGTLWSAGDTVLVSATGSSVPAFKASVVFPGSLELTSPTPVATISKSEGLSLTWKETNDDVAVLFSQLTGAGEIVDISCTAPAPSTGYTLSPAMLVDVLPDTGMGPSDTVFMLYTYRSTKVTAGSCQVTVQATADYGRYDWQIGVTE